MAEIQAQTWTLYRRQRRAVNSSMAACFFFETCLTSADFNGSTNFEARQATLHIRLSRAILTRSV